MKDIHPTLHSGELAVQERVGTRQSVSNMAAQMLRPFLSEQLQTFFPTLPFVVAAARDADGRVWATLLDGEPGFVQSPDPSTLLLDAAPVPGDALDAAFVPGADVGLLGIELETRRRNRVNGTLVASDGAALAFKVVQAFGNCPQYISTRERVDVPRKGQHVRSTRLDRLDGRARSMIGSADTLFVATGHTGDGVAAGMDASHRGGEQGFIEVVSERQLILPDYAGNRLFNTLGNLELDPRVGLSVVDFRSGELLQLSGRAHVEWAPDSPARHPGAQRLVHIQIEAVVRLEPAFRWRWLASAEARRKLAVILREPAGNDAVSLTLQAAEGQPLPSFTAGQYLPLQLPSGDARGLLRTYSLSGDPAKPTYRVTVKRDPIGRVSQAMHTLVEGDSVLVGVPAGDFGLPPGANRVALAGAGIGLTPIVAMAYKLAADGRATRVLAVVRDGAHAPLLAELDALARCHPHVKLLRIMTRPRAQDLPGTDYELAGRPDSATVTAWLEDLPSAHTVALDIDARLCGPPGFVGSLTALLEAAGVSADNIGSESF